MALSVLAIGLFFLAVLAVLAATATAVAAFVRSSRRRPEDVPAEVRSAAARHLATATLLGLAVAVTVAVLVGAIRLPSPADDLLSPIPPGIGLALSPIAAGLGWLGVQALAERTWPRPVGVVRSASLRPRTERRLLGSRPLWLTSTLAIHAITLPIYHATATGGTRVRGLQPGPTATDGLMSSQVGPYPGAPYTIPIGLGLLLLVLAAVLVTRWIAHRPAVPGLPEADDEALRETSVRRVVAGVQIAAGATAIGVNGVAALALRNVGHDGPAGAAVVPAIVGLIAVVHGAVCLARVTTRIPAGAASGAGKAPEG